MLAKAGVSVREAMGLMRHRSEALNTRMYVDASETVFGLNWAVDRITSPALTVPMVAPMTGTDDLPNRFQTVMGSTVGSAPAPRGTFGGNMRHYTCTSSQQSTNENPPVNIEGKSSSGTVNPTLQLSGRRDTS